jgi:hypothetical protein
LPGVGTSLSLRRMRALAILLALGLLAPPAFAADGRIDRAGIERAGIDRSRIADEARRPCPRFGPGFAAVPGTGACTRISGRVRAEAGTPIRRGPERAGALSGSGRLAIDTRTDTEYGPARAFVRFGTRR